MMMLDILAMSWTNIKHMAIIYWATQEGFQTASNYYLLAIKHARAHTHIYIYICVCVFVCDGGASF